jgi:WD40 repeat protein
MLLPLIHHWPLTTYHSTTRVKIVDFGLARLVEGTTGLTRLGDVLGTPSYMAPEQANGQEVDAGCDLFSLGCVLYRMATGRDAFRGKYVRSILAAVLLKAPTPPRELNPDLPEELAQLIVSLLVKDPADRLASAGEVAGALEALAGQAPQPPGVPGRRVKPVKKAAPPTLVPGGAPPERKRWPVPTAMPEGKATQLGPSGPGTAPPAAAPVPPERWRNLLHSRAFWVGTTLILALVLVLLRFTPAAILIVTNQGQVVVETDRDVVIVLKQEGRPVRELAAQARQIFTVLAGEYEVEIRIRTPQGEEVITKKVTLSRGGSLDLNVGQELAEARLQRLESGGELSPSAIPEEDRVSWLKHLVAVLGTHQQRHDGVFRVAISPDGRWVASAGYYDRLYLWDARSSMRPRATPKVGGAAAVMAFSPDSTTLATSVQLWDLTASKLEEGLPYGFNTNCVAYSPDGRKRVLGTDAKVVLWDQTDPAARERIELKGSQSPIVAVAACRKYVAAASRDKEKAIRLWDVSEAEPKECEPPALPAKSDVYLLAMRPDGKFLAAGIRGGLIRLWRLDGSKATALRSVRHGIEIVFVTFAPDGKTLASATNDIAQIRFWTATAKGLQSKRSAVLPSLGGRHFALRGDGQVMATACGDGTVRLWDLTQPTPAELFPIRGPRGPVTGIVFAPDSKGVAVATLDETRWWKLHGPRQRERGLFPGWRLFPPSFASLVGLTPDGSQLVTSSPKGMTVWSTADARRHLAVLEGHYCARSPKEPLLLIARHDHTGAWIDRYRLAGPAPILEHKVKVPDQHPHGLANLTISPDGLTLAAGSASGKRFLFGLGGGRLSPGPVIASRSGPGPLAFTPDSRTLISSGGKVKLWDLQGKLLFEGFSEFSARLALSPDGKTLATTDGHRYVQLWDYHTRKKLRNLEMPGRVTGVAISPDGRYLATGNGNGTVYIFRLEKLLEGSAK